MAKKTVKNHYYVLVFASNGPAYVTSIDNSTKYARWDKDETPLELTAGVADDLAFGLNANFHNAVVVKSRVELDTQPYNYTYFDCTFVKKEGE